MIVQPPCKVIKLRNTVVENKKFSSNVILVSTEFLRPVFYCFVNRLQEVHLFLIFFIKNICSFVLNHFLSLQITQNYHKVVASEFKFFRTPHYRKLDSFRNLNSGNLNVRPSVSVTLLLFLCNFVTDLIPV